ncbi:MAG: site-specific integrase, partial [Planctomycetota bacterium]
MRRRARLPEFLRRTDRTGGRRGQRERKGVKTAGRHDERIIRAAPKGCQEGPGSVPIFLRGHAMRDRIEEFLTHLEVERGCSPHTREAYRRDLSFFQGPLSR